MDKLRTFLETRGVSQSDLCRRIGAYPPDMSRWLLGTKPVPPERCALIERETEGEVRVEDLRPDVRWIRVPDRNWPTAGRPCLDLVGDGEAATEQGAGHAA